MTRYILTSPKFTGAINLLYNEFNMLSKTEFEGKLTDEQYAWILAKLPFKEEGITPLKKHFSIIQEVEEVTFEDFYETYKYKEGRQKAQHAWDRMPKYEKVKAYMYITTYKTKKKISGTALAYPATYLNSKPWED